MRFAGVPAGTYSTAHVKTSKLGTPDSLTVSTFGSVRSRVEVRRDWPAFCSSRENVTSSGDPDKAAP